MSKSEISNLWGEEFALPTENKKQTKQIVKKIKVAKEKKEEKPLSVDKQIKSKKISLQDRLEVIKKEVYRVLGKQKDNTIVIKSKEQLNAYIDESIKNGVITIDTETNNSLIPLECKLMGGCIYTPGQKQAYIPINHVNPETRELLKDQLTEKDLKEAFQKLITYHTKIIMHNGSFDYQVIKCTCDIALPIYWDTMIAARLLDENELAGLKYQYRTKIDPEQEKYDIENLFDAKNVEFAVVDPELFALYAATDAMMTYKLYEWQKERFSSHDLKKVYDLFMNVEMPIVTVTAKMELVGVSLDKEFAGRLTNKYKQKLSNIDNRIKEELDKLAPTINSWKLTPEANTKPKKKTGEGFGKSKAEQLEDPINLASPSQLAVLLYDVLKVPQVDKDSARGTGEDILKKLSDTIELPLCDLILERRGILKLLNTYIEALPQAVLKDGKIHCHFKQLGPATGRFACTDPNLQNIPAHEKSIRMLFTASMIYKDVDIINNSVQIHPSTEVLTETNNWVKAKDLKIGDKICLGDNTFGMVKNLTLLENTVLINL